MLKISDQLSLPIESITQTFCVIAKRGSGKTYCASVMAEEMLKAGQQIIVVDPTSAWAGLRSSADGKSPGFPIVVIGGEHADVPLSETAGEVIAQAVVEHRFSAILDLSQLRKGAVRRFLTPFLETLYRLNREPVHLFVDEADDVAPQKMFGDEAQLVGAMEDVVKRGRRKGIGCTMITQRPADLAKQVLTQCEVLVPLRLVHPRDIGAIKEWINVHADPDQAAEVIKSLPSLPIGTAWVWSPGWLDKLVKIKVRKRTTFDSSATPKVGEAPRKPKKLAEIDVQALGEQISATVEKAKADDPKELRKKVAELTKQVQGLEKQLAELPAVEPERVEVPIISDSVAKCLQETVRKIESLVDPLRETAEVIGSALHKTKQPAPVSAVRARPTSDPAHQPAKPKSEPSGDLGKCERSILAVLAQHSDGCEMGKLALLTGYRASGGYRNNLGNLRTLGFIDGGNTGVMTITDAGLKALGDYEPLPTGRDLAHYWLNHPSFGKCEKEILRALLENRDGLTMEQVATAAGYQASGGFRNCLGALRTAGVIVGRNVDVMRANEDLFD